MDDAADAGETNDAAAAFASLQTEVKRVRAEVIAQGKRLPDITDSVRAFEKQGLKTDENIALILARPALAQSPEVWLKRVNAALVEALSADQAKLAALIKSADAVLDRAYAVARSRSLFVEAATVVFAVVALVSLLTAWHYSDLVSTFRAETKDKWAAGSTFMQDGNPEQWALLVRKSRISLIELVAFESCHEFADTTLKPQTCKITVEPSKK